MGEKVTGEMKPVTFPSPNPKDFPHRRSQWLLLACLPTRVSTRLFLSVDNFIKGGVFEFLHQFILGFTPNWMNGAVVAKLTLAALPNAFVEHDRPIYSFNHL
jgi:hypothetical protein